MVSDFAAAEFASAIALRVRTCALMDQEARAADRLGAVLATFDRRMAKAAGARVGSDRRGRPGGVISASR